MNTPFWYACKAGNTAIVELLMKDDMIQRHNIDINCSDHYGNTPLMIASRESSLHAKVIQY